MPEKRGRRKKPAMWVAGAGGVNEAGVRFVMPPIGALALDPRRALVRAVAFFRIMEEAFGPAPNGGGELFAVPVSAADAERVRSALEDQAVEHPHPAGRRAARAGLGLDAECESRPLPAAAPPRDATCGSLARVLTYDDVTRMARRGG